MAQAPWLVDVHNHVIPAEVLDLCRRDPGFGVTVENGRWSGPHHVPFALAASFTDPETKLTDMDARAIVSAVVSCPPQLFFYGLSSDRATAGCEVDNEGMARFCAASAGRLAWLANLPMQDPPRAVQVYRAAAAQGCAGAAIGTSIAGRRLDEPAFEEFWAAAAEIGRPVLMHPAFNEAHAALEPYYLQNVIGNPLETTVAVERMICAGVFARHPQLRLLALHGGGYLPYQAGRLVHASRVRPEITIGPDDVWRAFAQVYFDTITHDEAALRYLVQRVGLDHVLLGTDLPFDMGLAEPAALLERALSAAEAQEVGARNAARLFRLDAIPGQSA